jgi:preprotein translocase subunit SecE
MTKHRKNKNTPDLTKNNTTEANAAPLPKPDTNAERKLPKKEAEKVKEPNAVMKFFHFLQDAKRELTKVTWPTRKETMTSTGILLVLVAISAVYLALVDGILTRLLRLIVG